MSSDDDEFLQIQVIEDPRYYEPYKGAKGYEELSGIGQLGWSGYEMDGWTASATTEQHVLVVMLSSPKADRGTMIKFLGMLAERVK